MNSFLPEPHGYYRNLAEQILFTLETEIHWFKLPTSQTERETKIRRWGIALESRNATSQEAQQALTTYLLQRWAKDPVPEPRDVLEHLPNQDETLGGQLRRFIASARRYNPFSEWLYWFHWEGVSRGLPEHAPSGLPETLDELGHKDLALINRYTIWELDDKTDEIRQRLKELN